MTTPFAIRRAVPNEAQVLSDLALRSKAYWNYSTPFLEASRPDLTLTAEDVEDNMVYLLEEVGTLRGFYELRDLDDGAVELEHLFIDPEAIGTGYGRKLWQHAVETARQSGFQVMFIHSDPNAETFYEAMGAVRIGHSESLVEPGRMLPLMRFTLFRE